MSSRNHSQFNDLDSCHREMNYNCGQNSRDCIADINHILSNMTPPPYINVGMTVCTGIECWDILLLFETNIELGGSGEFDVSPVILSQLENMPILLFKCQGILASCRQLKFKHTHGWVILFCVN